MAGCGPVDGGGPAVGPGQAEQHPQGGGLACGVGTEEAGDPAGPDFEAQAVNGGDVPVPPGEVADGDHRGCPFRPGTGCWPGRRLPRPGCCPARTAPMQPSSVTRSAPPVSTPSNCCPRQSGCFPQSPLAPDRSSGSISAGRPPGSLCRRGSCSRSRRPARRVGMQAASWECPHSGAPCPDPAETGNVVLTVSGSRTAARTGHSLAGSTERESKPARRAAGTALTSTRTCQDNARLAQIWVIGVSADARLYRLRHPT